MLCIHKENSFRKILFYLQTKKKGRKFRKFLENWISLYPESLVLDKNWVYKRLRKRKKTFMVVLREDLRTLFSALEVEAGDFHYVQ